MNTNNLKRFAQDTRRKLIEQVGAKLSYVLNADSALLREQADQVNQLRQALSHTTEEQLIEKVAYTWFNRLMALRFMDANDYQPLGIRVLTPKDGYTTPEILDEAKRGNILADLKVNRQKVFELLDGKIPSSNPQNEAFKHLLIASCNHLSTVLPFLFEKISDYTELLLPDDLTSEFSVISDILNGMLDEDCREVEIIGWLYQFYISEENARLIESKKVYTKNELAPASQLFTPKWIVKYMVDNTLGQLLTELYPATLITKQLEFYIKPAYLEQLKPREKKKLEEIKFFDPCVGSAHILSYAFDVFYLIYKELGYTENEIPELIISNNLYGCDIDERATQLSSFVLMMKGRQYYRRFLKKVIRPNIEFLKDYPTDYKFKNASVLGALINVEPFEIANLNVEGNDLFAENQIAINSLYKLFGQRYDLVVTNPPYISSSRMEGSLKQYVEANYPDTKSDLFATFIIRCLELCNEDGLSGYMSPFVWMFISSYEKLRENIIDNHFINNLVQLEYSGFDGATVPICTFTLRKKHIKDAKGSYIRLSDFKGPQNQAPKTIEAIQNTDCGWFHSANQKDFKDIPTTPIGYWLSRYAIDLFVSEKLLRQVSKPRSGMSTTNNERFIRFWTETSYDSIGIDFDSNDEFVSSNKTWNAYNKAGGIRWISQLVDIVNWKNDGEEIKNWLINNPKDPNTKHWSRRIFNTEYFFLSGISWGDISSSRITAKKLYNGFIFDSVGIGLYNLGDDENYILGLLNSKVGKEYLALLCPTLHFNPGGVGKMPIRIENVSNSINLLVDECIKISKLYLISSEFSNNFKNHNLINNLFDDDLVNSYDLYQQYWKNKFFQLHSNEEELNRQFIEIYGLQAELSPDIPLEDITILKEETYIENGELVFNAKEVFAQFMSYAVGCMFGRFSVDKEGIILANQGETLQDYLHKIEKESNECAFLPDEDNIIPVLDDEWFEDDVVGRFYQFLKVTFGEKNFTKNLAFIEEQLGKDIRKYFTRDFYADHIQRYKKRPIYWMFSSPKGSFNVLIYMHRYTPDTISNILNSYLREFVGKLKTRKEHLQHIMVSGSPVQITSAIKEQDGIDKMLIELQDYEREVLYPLATERITIDLDDGVLVNYNKLGKAVKEVKGLNDAATKKKVRGFDWIDGSQIR
jgi:hypothetical protein